MARTYRATPFRSGRTAGYSGGFGRTVRQKLSGRPCNCERCSRDRTFATDRRLAGAADALATDVPLAVEAELDAEWMQDAATPTYASTALIARYDEEQEEMRRGWYGNDDYDVDGNCRCWMCEEARELAAEEDWAKAQEEEWAWEQRARELAEAETLARIAARADADWAAFEAERAWAWDRVA